MARAVLPHHARHGLQGHVAGQMTERVVVQLEVVHIHHQHGKGAGLPVFLDGLIQRAPVAEAGEVVGQAQAGKALPLLLQLAGALMQIIEIGVEARQGVNDVGKFLNAGLGQARHALSAAHGAQNLRGAAKRQENLLLQGHKEQQQEEGRTDAQYGENAADATGFVVNGLHAFVDAAGFHGGGLHAQADQHLIDLPHEHVEIILGAPYLLLLFPELPPGFFEGVARLPGFGMKGRMPEAGGKKLVDGVGDEGICACHQRKIGRLLGRRRGQKRKLRLIPFDVLGKPPQFEQEAQLLSPHLFHQFKERQPRGRQLIQQGVDLVQHGGEAGVAETGIRQQHAQGGGSLLQLPGVDGKTHLGGIEPHVFDIEQKLLTLQDVGQMLVSGGIGHALDALQGAEHVRLKHEQHKHDKQRGQPECPDTDAHGADLPV